MDVIVPCKLCHLKQQKGPKVAIYSKKSYFSEKIIPFSYLLLAKSMKFILKLKNHTRVASVHIMWIFCSGVSSKTNKTKSLKSRERGELKLKR